jgi:hypothetical protein
MWEHENQTPFAVDHNWVRDKNGAEVWIIAIKATFDIKENGTLAIAKEQVPVCLMPEFLGDPAKSSLKYDSDVYHRKTTTDVLVLGQAHAPKGKPTTAVDVNLKVTNINKTLRVTGNRTWKTMGLAKMSEPETFITMPISYERAYGGKDDSDPDENKHSWDVRNPVGVSFAKSAAFLNDKPAPNVEYPNAMVNMLARSGTPAGFGPLACHWQPRVKWAGTYDQKWQKERQPLYPEDFDDRFFQCAPADQQTTEMLNGGEKVELTNLTPSGYLQFTLPRLYFGLQTIFMNGDVERHRPSLHTVIVEPDVPRLMMVWHSHLPCHTRVLKLKRTTVTQKQAIN